MALDNVLRDRLNIWVVSCEAPGQPLLLDVLFALRQLDDAVRKLEELRDTPELRDRR